MAIRLITSPISLVGLDPDLRTAIKGFEKVTVNSAESVEDFIPKLYKPKSFKEKRITFPVYAGLPDAETWDGKSTITAREMAYLHEITAEQYYWAQSVEFTFESQDFDIYGINGKKAKELGTSLGWELQQQAADFFNDGFATTAWADGVYFFSASHPLVGGGTQSNLISGALSHDLLMDGLVALRNMTDPLGRNKRPGQGVRLWVESTQGPLARYIVNESLNWQSGSADNNQNPFKFFGNIEVVEWPHWDTTTKWMLQSVGDFESYVSYKHAPRLFPVKETDSHGMKQDGMFCVAFWTEDYTSFVGSLGV